MNSSSIEIQRAECGRGEGGVVRERVRVTSDKSSNVQTNWHLRANKDRDIVI